MELRGKTILITRAASQTEGLRDALTKRGARVIECPAIEIVPVENWTAVDQAIANLASYDWLLLTSTNAVDLFMERVALAGAKVSVPIAVVGAATAERLTERQLTPSLIPINFNAEGLLEMFPAALRGLRILFPRAKAAREIIPEELRRRGATVDVITVYRTAKSEAGLMNLRATLMGQTIDCIAFASPSAIRFFAETLSSELGLLLHNIPIAVIGPVARESAESFGLTPAIQPETATVTDLAEAISNYFRRRDLDK